MCVAACTQMLTVHRPLWQTPARMTVSVYHVVQHRDPFFEPVDFVLKTPEKTEGESNGKRHDVLVLPKPITLYIWNVCTFTKVEFSYASERVRSLRRVEGMREVVS